MESHVNITKRGTLSNGQKSTQLKKKGHFEMQGDCAKSHKIDFNNFVVTEIWVL